MLGLGAIEVEILLGLGRILDRSPVIEPAVRQGRIGIVPSLYDLQTGAVHFLGAEHAA